jgi:phosphatidylserine/phosphatidylglycerophosphate/cardiolipin synthase-like enzyme
MRFKKRQNKIGVTAITGSNVVLLSLDMKKEDTEGLLGFAIERIDPKEDERYFLKGFKRFAYADNETGVDMLFTTFEHPVQSFLWEDFSAKENRKYTYNIIPVSGKPKKLEYGKPCSIEVETEKEHEDEHSVFFNRGVAGSIAYANRFKNKKPSQLSGDELKESLAWLSRGLKEALMHFIERAADPTFSLKIAFYEFTNDEVMEALKDRIGKNVSVEIIYDHRKEAVENDEKIVEHEFPTDALIKREAGPSSALSHNKFMILFKDGEPIAVWTGSTNITAKAIYGHCNTGHVINNSTVAAKYFEYWTELAKDPGKEFKDINLTITPELTAANIAAGTSLIFSPRQSLNTLETYAALIAGAKQLVCGMFPFSFYDAMKTAITTQTTALELILTDRRDKELILEQRADNIQVVQGTYFKDPLFNWVKEINSGVLFNENGNPNIGTNYVHNKVILIDPLTEDPIVIGGSANFSYNSIRVNDENSLIIRGNKRVADIYFTEFFRIFNHYYVRAKTQNINPATRSNIRFNPLLLNENSSWVNGFFRAGSFKTIRKEMFNSVQVL